MRTLKYFLADAAKHKSILHQLDFIGEFLQVTVKNRSFVKLDSRYADYFPEYSNYFGRALILLKYMYGMNNSGKLFFWWFNRVVTWGRFYSISMSDVYIILGLILCWWLCLLVYFWISWKMVCGYFREEIPCELLGVCTLVHVNHTFSDEGSFHFYGSV